MIFMWNFLPLFTPFTKAECGRLALADAKTNYLTRPLCKIHMKHSAFHMNIMKIHIRVTMKWIVDSVRCAHPRLTQGILTMQNPLDTFHSLV
jgi:hypothetical protein